MSLRRCLAVSFALAGPLALGCAGQSASSQASATPDTATEIAATCEHVVELARATPAGQDPAVLTRVQADCNASLAETADLDAAFTSCIRTATSAADIDACEQATTRHSSVLRGLEPSNQAVCVVCVMAADTVPTMMACKSLDPDPEPVTESTGDAAIKGLPTQPTTGVMANAIYAPNPDPAALQNTNTARFNKVNGISVVEFCVETNGETSGIRTIQKFPDDPQIDQILRETVAKWRFEPFMLDGKPIKTCSQKTFKLTFK